jgi:hypothetical protein
MSKANLATIPDELLTITQAAKVVNRPYTSVYSRVRKGKITVRFTPGDTEAKVSLSEVKKDFETVPKRFSAPTFRIVRHEEESVDVQLEAQPEKSDLFA